MSDTPVPVGNTSWDYELGHSEGQWMEYERIIALLEAQVSEWLSHDGECDCRVKGEEGVRLIGLIKGRSY